MKFIIPNNILVENLKKINRLLVKNTSLPILENILIEIKKGILSLTATNLEIEIIVNIQISKKYILGKATISGRKILNICRNLPEMSNIQIELKNKKIYISSEKSRYILVTLPTENFPNHQNFNHISSFYISSDILKNMIIKTEFAMGKQDVRYYLNGMLFEQKENYLRNVATDGYRLATSYVSLKEKINSFSIIVPHKGIIEILRLLNIKETLLHILIGTNNLRIHINNLIFTTQLIEGKYPDYKSVLLENPKKPIIINNDLLKKSLLRTSILSHEKFSGIEINIKSGELKTTSDNQEEETAEDKFNIEYFGDTIEISINVYYILDVLNTINSKNILLFLNKSQSSIQIESENNSSTIYVIMLLKR
ncbi:DNA polymerase III subunit beta [Buchnera aphidicola (Aphis helianthi)]|uniref:Beta sliding clamp n=1 Tax=Buchnera aphidicola (Aphis helianthi) TaxID=2315802 RepID=A0A4D6XPJ7_9GAMM|nr:DNA polymerase III subunit beta [Buchnera aphidicola]QCI16858.1 DNA polymerase III subunit beta [Buchnera aphidicola (Aphis helianthi)]